MIELGAIQTQTTVYAFVKNDIEDFEVKGNVTVDKDNNITNVNGEIIKNGNIRIAGFNTWGSHNDIRFNTNDCKEEYLIEVSEMLKAVIGDLKNTI